MESLVDQLREIAQEDDRYDPRNQWHKKVPLEMAIGFINKLVEGSTVQVHAARKQAILFGQSNEAYEKEIKELKEIIREVHLNHSMVMHPNFMKIAEDYIKNEAGN